MVDARLLIDLQGSMDENRPSVIGGPASVLDVFGAPSDQVRPGLADRKNFHGLVLRHITGCSLPAEVGKSNVQCGAFQLILAVRVYKIP